MLLYADKLFSKEWFKSLYLKEILSILDYSKNAHSIGENQELEGCFSRRNIASLFANVAFNSRYGIFT